MDMSLRLGFNNREKSKEIIWRRLTIADSLQNHVRAHSLECRRQRKGPI
jgi:hypothetical protein